MKAMHTKKISKQKMTARALAYLKRNRLMTLATSSRNTPWAATVFYAYDAHCNIYFYSREDTKHCRQIAKNPSVGMVINHDWQQRDGSIRGMQIVGRAAKVPRKEYAHSYAHYRTRFPWADEFAADHILYRVTPREIWYIDEKLFGHFERVKVR